MQGEMAMKGYVVIDTEVINPEAYSEYVEKVLGVIAAHGGRFLVRTSDAEPFDGGWEPKRLVIMEFESLEAAKGFIGSAEFTAIDGIRKRGARSKIIVVEGYDAGA